MHRGYIRLLLHPTRDSPVNTRRQFLIKAPVGLVSVAAACQGATKSGGASDTAATTSQATPGAPVAFGTAGAVGPEVTATTFAEAGKLMQVSHSDAERAMMASSWRRAFAPSLERRVGPRKVDIPDSLVPAMLWDPAQAIGVTPAQRDRFVRSANDAGALPSSDDS